MFSKGKRISEHDDIYGTLKIDREVNQLKKKQNTDNQGDIFDEREEADPFKSIKEKYSLDKQYEIYLETEKKSYLWTKKFNQDPMEVVANKLRRAEDLDSNDLKYWVTYNFLAFPKEEQDKVKALVERQQWFWRRSMFILPPLFYFSYAIVSYQYRSRLLPNMIICSGICLGFTKLGLYSSNKDMSIYYKELFDKYKDEVLDPQFRGLKLHKQKKIYQIDQKEFTSSKFDDLKAMVMSQMRK